MPLRKNQEPDLDELILPLPDIQVADDDSDQK